jgi:hypothetical protein
VFLASALPLCWVLAKKWRALGRPPPLAPLAGLVVTVWLWTVYSSVDPLLRYAIPALHSVQYLYFVWLLRRNEARATEGPPHFGLPARVRVGGLAVAAVALGWVLLRGGPAFVDGALAAGRPRHADPGPLGATPFLAAVYVFVNIHHYFMDHVIWRRENPETRYLMG